MRRTLIGEVGQLHREAGFTLLEMIVVLAIMAMAIAFATSSISNSGGAVRLQPLAVRVAADLKLARADAISQNHPVEVEFDAKAHAYRIQGSRAPVALPGSIGFSLATSREFSRSSDRAHLVFFPDGSSTGGRLTLTDRQTSITLAIDWLTGTVTARRAAQ